MTYVTTWEEAQEESFQCAYSKGWWDECKTWRDGVERLSEDLVAEKAEEKVLLVCTEISEAVEDFRVNKMVTELLPGSGKPVGFPTELADVCIRIWDYTGAKGYQRRLHLGNDLRSLMWRPTDLHRGVVGHLLDLTTRTCRLVSSNAFDLLGAEELVYRTIGIGQSLGIDMVEEINKKMAFNRTRSFRHGGKAI